VLPFICGCGRQYEVVAANPGDEQNIEIVCHFFYRSSTRTPKGETRQFTINVPFVDGDVPEIALDISKEVAFKDLACVASAHYNSLSVRFQGADTRKTITSLLYQFGDKPDNRFAGGHGFTGLHYIYHPETEAELQFWAVVKESGSRGQE
jgi:hypothetical protein